MSGPLLSSHREPSLIRGARPVLPGGLSPRPLDVLVARGAIEAIGERLASPPGARVADAAGLFLLPGWIDLQVNDIAWLAQGPRPPEEHARRIAEVCEHQARRGVTGLLLATLAAPIDEVLGYLAGMRRALDDRAAPTAGAFLGALVEGTFMNPQLCGAQNPRWVLPPTRELVDRLLDTGVVRCLNIAPETAPEAVELIAHATRRGAIVGAGHSKAHAERFREAVAAGLRYVIHLGNGPTGSSLKCFHDGGLLEEALRNDAVTATVILDGVHVHLDLVRDWIARKEISRVVAVSDAGFATEVPAGGFEVFGIRGERSACGRYLRVVPHAGAAANPYSSDAAPLFGSAVHLPQVFETALGLLTREMAGVHIRRHPALPFDEALHGAAELCSRNPARLLGLADRGEIRPGARADLVLVEVQGAPGAYRARVEATWLA